MTRKKVLIHIFCFAIIVFSCKSNRYIENDLNNYLEYRNNLTNIYNSVKDFLSIYQFISENEYYIFDTYGFQKNIFTDEYYFVDFIYIGVKFGNKIFSITDGEIIDIGYNEIGNYIKIKIENIIIEYGNLIDTDVKIGDKIKNKQYIGSSGRLIEPYGNVLILRIKYKSIPLNPVLMLNYDNNMRYIVR